MRISTIVVARTSSSPPDRALSVAAALARSGSLPVEVVTVLPPDDSVTWELQGPDALHGVQRTIEYALHGDRPGEALAQHVTGRPGALLVIAATTHSASGVTEVDTTTEEVLGHVRQPVLVVGPRSEPSVGSLLVAVDESGIGDAAVSVVDCWVHSFPCGETHLVTVVPPCAWPAGEDQFQSALLDRHVRHLTDRGIAVNLEVLRERDPVHALLSRAASVGGTILVVSSPRFRDGLSHWYDTARTLVRFAACPVLVVPEDLD